MAQNIEDSETAKRSRINIGKLIQRKPELISVVSAELTMDAYEFLQPEIEPKIKLINPAYHSPEFTAEYKYQFKAKEAAVMEKYFSAIPQKVFEIRRRLTPRALLKIGEALQDKKGLTLTAHSPFDLVKNGHDVYSMRLWISPPEIDAHSGHPDWYNNIELAIAECWAPRSDINKKLREMELPRLELQLSPHFDCKEHVLGIQYCERSFTLKYKDAKYVDGWTETRRADNLLDRFARAGRFIPEE